LDRNGLSVSTEIACRFEPKPPAENSEICILEPIGNRPPAEAEAAYYAQLELTCIAA